MQDEDNFQLGSDVCGVLVQYPATDGSIHDYKVGCLCVVCAVLQQPFAVCRLSDLGCHLCALL